MIEVNIVPFEASFQESITEIRHSVFTLEQGIDHQLDFDGLDVSAQHALVLMDGKAVGTGRMLSDGHIGRIAVLNKYRGLGLGNRMMQQLIEHAQKSHYERVYLGSQCQALPFYLQLGFSQYGDEYIEVGIKHMTMEKWLN